MDEMPLDIKSNLNDNNYEFSVNLKLNLVCFSWLV